MAEIRDDDLRCDARMADLWRDAVERGDVVKCDRHRLQFYAAAEHALRVADRPPALFRWTVAKIRSGGTIFVSCSDEDAAAARIRRAEQLEDRRPAGPAPVRRGRSRAATPRSDAAVEAQRRRAFERLSQDARIAGAAVELGRRNGTDAREALRRTGRLWSEKRWRDAMDEWFGYSSFDSKSEGSAQNDPITHIAR